MYRFGGPPVGAGPILFGTIVAQRESLLCSAFGVTQASHGTTKQQSCRTLLGAGLGRGGDGMNVQPAGNLGWPY